MITKEAYKKLNDNTDGVRFIRPFSEYTLQEVIDALTELEELKRYPTLDEVCEALSEYYGKKVIFKENAFWYKTIICGNEQWVREVSLKDLSKDNRGDLITLIGRFYEGLEELK